MSAIWNGPKNGSRKPKHAAHDLVEVLARRLALGDDRERLAQQRHLQAVGDEADAVGDLGGLLADVPRSASDPLHDARSVCGPRDHLDARCPLRRVEPVHAEEALRVVHRLGERRRSAATRCWWR